MNSQQAKRLYADGKVQSIEAATMGMSSSFYTVVLHSGNEIFTLHDDAGTPMAFESLDAVAVVVREICDRSADSYWSVRWSV